MTEQEINDCMDDIIGIEANGFKSSALGKAYELIAALRAERTQVAERLDNCHTLITEALKPR